MDPDTGLIIPGGFSIYSNLSKDIVNLDPRVPDCAAIGVPSADMGVGIVAAQVLRDRENAGHRGDEGGTGRCVGPVRASRRSKTLGDRSRDTQGMVRKAALRERFVGAFADRART